MPFQPRKALSFSSFSSFSLLAYFSGSQSHPELKLFLRLSLADELSGLIKEARDFVGGGVHFCEIVTLLRAPWPTAVFSADLACTVYLVTDHKGFRIPSTFPRDVKEGCPLGISLVSSSEASAGCQRPEPVCTCSPCFPGATQSPSGCSRSLQSGPRWDADDQVSTTFSPTHLGAWLLSLGNSSLAGDRMMLCKMLVFSVLGHVHAVGRKAERREHWRANSTTKPPLFP